MKLPGFPQKLKDGNASCTIYRNANSLRPEAQEFKLAFYGIDGKRRFRSFGNYSEARREAEAILRKAVRGELETIDLDKSAVVAYSRAVRALKPFNLSVDRAAEELAACLELLGGRVTPVEAVRAYCRKYPKELPSRMLNEVVEELLAAKQQQGLSDVYVADLRYRCRRFAKDFRMPIRDVTAGDIRAWLTALKVSPRSHNNFVRTLKTLFEFAKQRGYLPKHHDELGDISLRKSKGSPIEIFTPDEIGRLLAKASAEALPVLAIGAFAGLRSAEIERLDWREIHLEERFIEVPAAKAKTASRRLAPLSTNLAQWLAPYARCEGKVWPHGHAYLYETMRATAKATGETDKSGKQTPKPVAWKRNALRHSFISYRLAEIQNVSQVALEAGNSATMIFQHYRELVRPAEAAKWFAVVPECAANVISTVQANLAATEGADSLA